MKRRKRDGPVIAVENDMFEITLSTDDRSTLLSFVNQLSEILAMGPDDPRLRRLFPTAYHENPAHDAEYQGYMRDELTQSRAASIVVMTKVLESTELITASQLHAFMTVLNNLRLVLGTLLDVSEDDFEDDIDEDNPAFGQWQLYGYLGWLLEWTISALSGEDN
ncbi:MAG: hypothetical protein CK521_05175 [Acidimicrobium sp.]|nr:DUF2017 family protein [Ilumatobacteraceae bacterium]PHX71215.1 MAG: hypothetical protein CK521_05175 [Acidimicrobium sp.]